MGRRGPYSLRRRLTGSIVGASFLVWAVSLAIVLHVAWKETSDAFDDSLKESARLAFVLGAALQRNGALQGEDAATPQQSPRAKIYYQLVSDDGRVLRRASGAPSRPFSDDLGRSSGMRDVWADEQAWRVYVLRVDGQGFQVQVGQPWDERLDLLDEVAEALAYPALTLAVLLGGFTWWIIRRLLRPIERTAGRIAAKSADDLRPVPVEREPQELLPIVNAFNLVIERLDRALQTERRFTADAAHELRTPLAALRMRIQLMQRRRSQAMAGDPADGLDGDSLAALRDEVDRCTGLIESLLALARLDPQQPESLVRDTVDVRELCEEIRRSEAQLEADDDRLTCDCRVDSMRAHPALLRSALRNLVDNSLRYGSPDTRVRIEALRLQDGRVRIAVRDDGPGVSASDRARLGGRFFRVLGTERAGHGLGLSIVARIVALHGAALSFEDGLDGRGLAAVIDFPLDATAPSAS